mmetsp:Transcript_37044/g.110948  ORF Transcript_37044/g.110948 Transcript_37044/m.110948 type:complete len:120 (-) Transcript_37044:910-1269(-)
MKLPLLSVAASAVATATVLSADTAMAFSPTTALTAPAVVRASRSFSATGPASVATQLNMAADPSSEEKKETTWDRITGPKIFKTVTNWSGIHSVPLVPLRVLTGLLMVHHGSEGRLLIC